MRKGFDQRLGTGFPKNIKSSEKHRPVARNIKHPAAHTPNAAILNAEPMLHKVQLQSVLPAGRNRHYVMGMSKPMPFVKTTIADVGSITSETTEAAAEDVPFRHPNIAARIRVRKMSYDDPDRKHAMRSARKNFNRIHKCFRSGEGLSKDQIRPYLGYSNLGMALSDANSNSNSLQLSLTKRAGFVTGTFAYTYSKAMGDGGGAGDAYNENPQPECPFTCLVSTAYQASSTTFVGGTNPVLVNGGFMPVPGGTQTGGVVKTWKQFDYGKLSFDSTHIVAASFTIEPPWGRSMTGVEGAAVKGWSLSAIMHFQTGGPLTATASQAVGSNGVNITRRASVVPGQSIAFSGTCSNPRALCWVNPNVFALENPLGAGDTPIGDIVGPNYYQWDLSLRKTFNLPFREGMRLQFQADAFNVFNRTNWNNPVVNNAGTSSFGQITGALPARVLQFGGKFSF
jgi:hypothetical protein